MEVAEKINMQLYNRLVKIEKENQKLKRALEQFNWIINTIQNLKTITEVITIGDERKSIECRQTDIRTNCTKK